jgi:transcriptional regulator with XRE-family HTH domain
MQLDKGRINSLEMGLYSLKEQVIMKKYVESSAERIRRIRLIRSKYLNEKSFSLDELCEKVGISRSKFSQIESGRVKDISPVMLKGISDTLDVSMEYILTGEKTVEDEGREAVLFLPQIGSLIHAKRMELKNKPGNIKEFSLKAVAGKLGICEMDLLRIETFSKSRHLKDKEFLVKLSEVLQIDPEDIEVAISTSFPQGEEKKQSTYRGKEIVILLKQDSRIYKSKRFPVDISEEAYDQLIKRLEFELGLL